MPPTNQERYNGEDPAARLNVRLGDWLVGWRTETGSAHLYARNHGSGHYHIETDVLTKTKLNDVSLSSAKYGGEQNHLPKKGNADIRWIVNYTVCGAANKK